MHAPIVGPANPNTKNGLAAGLRNHRAGHVEVIFVFSTFLTIDLHSLRDVDLLLYQVEASADIELGWYCDPNDAIFKVCIRKQINLSNFLLKRSKGDQWEVDKVILKAFIIWLSSDSLQDHHMHNFHFDNQYNTYQSVGSCTAPEGQQSVGAPGQEGIHPRLLLTLS